MKINRSVFWAAVLFLFCISVTEESGAQSLKLLTEKGIGDAQADGGSAESVRNKAILSAQQSIIRREIKKILPDDAARYFEAGIARKILDNAADFFVYMTITSEKRGKGVVQVSIEGSYNPDLLKSRLEGMGLPVGIQPLKIIFYEVNPGVYNILRHLEMLGIKPAAADTKSAEITPEQLGGVFEKHPGISLLLETVRSSSVKDNGRYRIRVYAKGQKFPVNEFSFQVNTALQSEPDRAEQLLPRLNLTTLKYHTLAEYQAGKMIAQVSGLNRENLPVFLSYALSPTGSTFFDMPDSATPGKVVIGLKGQDINAWLTRINAENTIFSLELLSQQDSFVTLGYRSKLSRKTQPAIKKVNPENNFIYYAEQEPNESFYEFNTVSASSPVYGTLRTRSDNDTFRADVSNPVSFIFKKTNKSSVAATVRIYDSEMKEVKKLLLDGKNYELNINMQDLGLSGQFYIAVSSETDRQAVNLGGRNTVDYMFQIN